MQDKFTSFENRLAKVYKHIGKIARKQNLACFRVYDVDLPEFPFIIDVYKDMIYVAEYKSKHKLSEEDYEIWLNTSMEIIQEVFGVEKAQASGLVHAVFHGAFDQAKASEIFSTQGAEALRATKKLLNSLPQLNWAEQKNLTTTVISERRSSAEGQTRLKNFLSKSSI